jgi:uncharacterized membrane protein YphA (DoxX/SURF4 family)
MPGRILYAGATIGFGLVCLLYADFINALQPMPAWVPGYSILAVLNGGLLVALGVALALDRQTRAAATVVAAFFALWILSLQVPSAFTNPSLLRSPWWIRTFESLALIGGGLALAGSSSSPVRESWIRYGRVAFGVSMPVFGVLHVIYPESVASLVPPWYPWPMFWAYATGMAQIAGGLAIASGVLSRPASILAGVMYGTWGLTLHLPRVWCRLRGPCDFLDAPVGLATSRGGLTSLFVAFAMCGSAWLVSGGIARMREVERVRDLSETGTRGRVP